MLDDQQSGMEYDAEDVNRRTRRDCNVIWIRGWLLSPVCVSDPEGAKCISMLMVPAAFLVIVSLVLALVALRVYLVRSLISAVCVLPRVGCSTCHHCVPSKLCLVGISSSATRCPRTALIVRHSICHGVCFGLVYSIASCFMYGQLRDRW